RGGRHGDDLADIRFDAVTFKRAHHGLALQRATGRIRHVLIGAAAAGPEMDAQFAAVPRAGASHDHAFLAAIRNSRLPSPPLTGLSIVPITSQDIHAAMSSRTAFCAASSRTTPPLPTCSLPASNCGLTSAISHASFAA